MQFQQFKAKAYCVVLTSILLGGCNSGSTAVSQPSSSQNITIATYNYNPGNKTGVQIEVGGSMPINAEIDTGSELTVINESVVGTNIIKTNQFESITYGGGQNTVSGYLAYGSVTFTTTSGIQINSSPDTPLLVVTQGSVDDGGGNNAILGMRMNTQASVRLYLPEPYNQMMILNRSLNLLTFGALTSNQLTSFADIQQVSTPCANYHIPMTINTTCWNLSRDSINYNVTSSGSESTYNYSTILDSGEAISSFYFSSPPSWMSYDSNNIILTPITVTANTTKGLVPLPLTSQSHYVSSPGNTVNPGNNLFNYYQVLFDQVDGIIGFADPNLSLK